ncbi:MAG: hypothetical protein HY608_05475, partial [Planctomycetes bacterium]|nr:hypothetical protein [Planctomycetota bacterium]
VLLNTEEDLDADGVLDSGEDLNMNGILDFLDYTAASRVGRTISSGPLRYRVTFKPTPSWPAGDPRYMNDPILESPWFDDITVLVQPRGYPRTLSWTAP